MSERDAAIAAELRQLRDGYLAKLPEELAKLAQLASELTGQVGEEPAIETLHQGLHKLAGSGGTFGLDALSLQARALEDTVRVWLDVDFGTIDAAQRNSFSLGVAGLAETIPPIQLGLRSPLSDVVQTTVPPDATRRTRVWLVEDDVPLGETLVGLLDQFDYDVRHYSRIDAAESAARTERPDILIMDVMFTDEGVNATEALLACPALRALKCPLLFISAHGDFKSRVSAARLGADGFVMKPLDVPRLVDRLERVLETRVCAPYRVLIVDDDTILASHFGAVLRSVGMEVAVLNQPEAVIETVSAFQPELVLMDLYMPGYSGPELATVIRHYDEWVGLPIVYLSAETDRDKQLLAMTRGADDFLTKPISDAHLIAAVKVRAQRSRQLADLMSKDSLTGLLKHARIKETIALEFARAQRSAKPLSVAMLDLDHFKAVNDSYGHAVGDRVIKALAHLLKQRLRKADGIGRYGGEEFVVILPECDGATAHRILDDIRTRFSALRFQHQDLEFSVTLSAGIACTAELPNAAGAALLIAADEALYAAKHGGRNQVHAVQARR